MRLLLLLSALLAALSGASAEARSPHTRAVAAAARLAAPAPERAHAHVLRAVRPIAAPSETVVPALRPPLLRAAPRLWSLRRRE